MKHKKFKRVIEKLYNEWYCGSEIVVFGRHKYLLDKEYEPFEIILSKEDGIMTIDWDYHEGEDDYLLDGWGYLCNIIREAHKDEKYSKLGGKYEN